MAVIAVKQLMKETGPSSTRRPCRPPSFIRSFQKITLFMMETAKNLSTPTKSELLGQERIIYGGVVRKP